MDHTVGLCTVSSLGHLRLSWGRGEEETGGWQRRRLRRGGEDEWGNRRMTEEKIEEREVKKSGICFCSVSSCWLIDFTSPVISSCFESLWIWSVSSFALRSDSADEDHQTPSEQADQMLLLVYSFLFKYIFLVFFFFLCVFWLFTKTPEAKRTSGVFLEKSLGHQQQSCLKYLDFSSCIYSVHCFSFIPPCFVLNAVCPDGTS